MTDPRTLRARRRARSRFIRLGTTVAFLLPVGAFVVYSSFRVSAVECEVCIRFEGREICRTVTAQTEQEGLRSATDNACGLLASGVTDTLRCNRTEPLRASCRKIEAR